jgi:CheY-like chemotaxis protein
MDPQQPLARLLLVEDDLNLIDLYTARLEAEGFEVKNCPDGEKALQVVKEYLPDLVLLDIMMPMIDGFDVLDIMRNTPATKDIKVIVMTALNRPEDVQKAKDLGAMDFLVKSQISMMDLVTVVRRHLNLPPPKEQPSAQ